MCLEDVMLLLGEARFDIAARLQNRVVLLLLQDILRGRA